MEETVFFYSLNSDFSVASEKQEINTWISNSLHTLTDKVIVNRTLSSLHEGSLEINITVPSNMKIFLSTTNIACLIVKAKTYTKSRTKNLNNYFRSEGTQSSAWITWIAK